MEGFTIQRQSWHNKELVIDPIDEQRNMYLIHIFWLYTYEGRACGFKTIFCIRAFWIWEWLFEKNRLQKKAEDMKKYIKTVLTKWKDNKASYSDTIADLVWAGYSIDAAMELVHNT